MNVTDANKHIAALNRIAEGVTMLASAIEETAWEGFEDHAGMPGSRPIAAAQLAQPDLEEAAAEYEATHQQAPEPAPEPVSLARVRGVLAGLSSQGLTEQVRELIVATGADKLSAVDPAKYGWLLTKASELSDA
ncbi:RRNA biogenesis protein rrp5 [Propionibacterium freudenreichii]|uniref:hypothetical protein n=1 Tax=Propionibacterium freudenreichii TaxID=1744 RepID=UPI00054288D9|nr:hypothetical protein [Propionibacterium freudenreichii]CEH06940.1 Phage-associated protein [Propionibacterium freudenreichii]SCQ73645.1 RRNA biogenesis protein rrp5 [Propionibacterium freudenreichii]SCQ82077.1 RRNA biogenesis protein rrp5 [Propionibacterium freudenreichii]